MPSILLTGANSFFAAHVINALINANYHVTGTVRQSAAGDAILALHPEWKGHFDSVVIEDIADESSWDSVFKKTPFDHVRRIR
jgi:nucleoside-diphosphate-sugar epimerase